MSRFFVSYVTLFVELAAEFMALVGIHGVEIAVCVYPAHVVHRGSDCGLMRVSIVAALSAIPPHPQIPMMPMRSGSTSSCVERKSTAAQKSSVLMSGEAT